VLKHIRGVQLDGETFLVPFDWGNTSIAYRPDLVEIEEESYSILLDERYKGRMSMFDSSETAAAIGGLLTGARDAFNMSDEELAKAFDTVGKIHQNLRFYWTDPTQIAQALAAGELVATTAWNETSLQLKQEGVNVKYMNPKEGMLTWVCGLALVNDGPGDEQQKYDVLNAILDPEVGVFMINEYGYGHSNEKSYELVDPVHLEELGVGNPAAMLVRTKFFDEMPNDVREKVNAMFEQVKAGL
jgi:spermidine/putrescine-binding protein